MAQIKGKIRKVFGQSPLDGKRLVSLSLSDGSTANALVDIPNLQPGQTIILTGSYEQQPSSRIFMADSWRPDRDAELFSGKSPFTDEDRDDVLTLGSIESNDFTCTVERILFTSENTGYCVVKVRPDGRRETVTVCGTIPVIRPGVRMHVTGEWKNHLKYGRQMVCDSYEIIQPTDADGICKYLSTGIIKGIGKVSAKKIVAHFGDNTLSILDSDPSRIEEVPTLARKKKQLIRENWAGVNAAREVMVFLGKHGLPITLASKITAKYGSESIHILKRNPYTLSDDISGVGFKTADLIAKGLGIQHDDTFRIRYGVRAAMNQICAEGNTYATPEELLSFSQRILEVGSEQILPVISRMCTPALIQEGVDADIIDDRGHLYLRFRYSAEVGVARRLAALLRETPSKVITRQGVNFDKIESETHIHYDDYQRQAILSSVTEKVSVITGGPGTGKTTITNAIIKALKQAGMDIILVAPTGRAAKRMSVATGMKSSTIHRLLEADEGGFARDESTPIKGDAIIIDESSMIDISLMNALLKAVPPAMKVIIVGDVDQLPSVGCGNVLRDIIESDVIPTVRLKKIYRQEGDSRIISNAHLINDGQMPDVTVTPDTDFFFMRRDDPEELRDTVIDLVVNRLPEAYNLYPSDIQVLSPMKKTILGVNELNAILQKKINPGEAFYHREDMELRVSDKVLQKKNNYDKQVYNGDIGFIESVKTDEDGEFESASVRFEDNREVLYEKEDLEELELAYATTVHKSQGSEYPIVVIPVSTLHYTMLRRNLLYTAVTRAKKICVLVGSTDALRTMVENDDIIRRNSLLKERLRLEVSLSQNQTNQNTNE